MFWTDLRRVVKYAHPSHVCATLTTLQTLLLGYYYNFICSINIEYHSCLFYGHLAFNYLV